MSTSQDKQIQQVLSFAGTGKLADGNETSNEFRTYLADQNGHLLGDVPALFIVAAVLGVLTPRRVRPTVTEHTA